MPTSRSWKNTNNGGLASPQDIHEGAQVPSFDQKPITIKSPPNSHDYTTCLKERPPVNFLSITTGVGNSV